VKTYCITIEPVSSFGTALKGDTLFGQFCWQAAYDANLLSVPFEEAITRYSEQPFAIFSTAFPALPGGAIALKRPDAPLELLFNLAGKSREDVIGNRKVMKRQNWLVCDKPGALANLQACRYLDEGALIKAAGLDADSFSNTAETGHNSINRLTGTTGGDGFAPFTQENRCYAPGSRLALIVGIDETMLTIASLLSGLSRIGQSGFGRDASTGMGRFVIQDHQEIVLASYGAAQPNALYTLAPCVPEPDRYSDALFTTFTRFGRHGDHLATSGKPYKNPVIMLDEGALLYPADMDEALRQPYLGTALSGLSKIQETAVAQGYSLCIPVRLEVSL
jgi:CRISPR-associated protein Csm4